MTKKEYFNTCYAIAKEKGFFDKPENQSISGNIVHIGSELGEVYDAHRKNKRFELKKITLFDFMQTNKKIEKFTSEECIFLNRFTDHVKNTFEDELADVLIRSYSMCGHFNLNPEPSPYNETLKLLDNANTVPDKLCLLCEQLFSLRVVRGNGIGDFIQSVEKFCSQVGVDVYKFVDLKIEYNKTRPACNGKEY